MKDNMLERAKANLYLAQQILKLNSDDELQINFAGYHLEQAVEFAVKFELDNSGIEYPKTHDIENLLRIASENNVVISGDEYIFDHAEMFSKWEASSRYIIGYLIEKKKVEIAITHVIEYLEKLSKIYQ